MDKAKDKFELPDVIVNRTGKRTYKKGKFLGRVSVLFLFLEYPNVCFSCFQGGFAKCYEFIDMSDNRSYACKVISKAQLVKDKHKTKVLFDKHFSLYSNSKFSYR